MHWPNRRWPGAASSPARHAAEAFVGGAGDIVIRMDESAPAKRRRRLAERMRDAGGGVAIVPTAVVRPRNADSEHPYRWDSYFHYLTGFTEPEAWLVLDADGRSQLFCRPRNADQEIWDGVRLGVERAVDVLGVDEAWPVGELDHRIPDMLANQPQVWTPFGVHAGLESRVESWLAALRPRSRSGVQHPRAHLDLRGPLDEMRLVKDDVELDTLREAARISGEAHVRAMRFAARRARLEPGSPLHEYEIEAELLHEFRRNGAQSPAYPSIVASGPNACVLHHSAGSRVLSGGELCLVDAGCELDGYASDITRTWPANGRFSPEQRRLYDIVLAAQKAAIAETRPGARKQDAHWAAVKVLSEGLLEAGLLTREHHGDVDAVVENATYRRFYMHGTGHWLGCDVHDVGEYLALDEPPESQLDVLGGRVVRHPSRRLAPGMVLTIEPGLYVQPAADIPEAMWHIGVRIEDDAIVTATGCELPSRVAPVEPEEIEALMRD
jgi:Xaa-Pro aminopeptidase